MSYDQVTPVSQSFGQRIARALGLRRKDKLDLSPSRDRMSALDDPETRRAIADLPEHLLRDIGVRNQRIRQPDPETPDGEALRRHMW